MCEMLNNIYLIVWFSCWNQLFCQDLISSHLLLIMYVTGVCMTGPLMQPSVSKIKMKALPAIHICHQQSRSCASPLSARKCAGTAFVSEHLRHSVLNDESVTRKELTYTIAQLEQLLSSEVWLLPSLTQCHHLSRSISSMDSGCKCVSMCSLIKLGKSYHIWSQPTVVWCGFRYRRIAPKIGESVGNNSRLQK